MRTGLVFVMAAAGCSTQAGPAFPRPSLTLQVPGVPRPESVEVETRPDGRTVGTLRGDGEEVRFELRPARATDAGTRAPLVLLVPILAGGRELMGLVAERLCAEGFEVAFCERAGSAMSAPQRAPDLDELFRRTVLHQRLLLAWLRGCPTPPPTIHVMGMSVGGMVSTVLAAQEPDLDGVAICLAGADLADLVVHSSEVRVRRWLDWRRHTDGVGDDTLAWEMSTFLSHEPLRFAPTVATDKVLFVSAALDTVVPRRNQDLLWEALGRPRRLDLPFGHYTAALAIDGVVAAAAEHFRAQPGHAPSARP